MNWSFSSLMVYESCAYRFKLAKIDKMPEPPRAPDNPMERGNRIHNSYEAYVKGESTDYDREARAGEKFRPHIDRLRELYACGMATAEDNWLFDRDWEKTDRSHVWLWSKLDACVMDEVNKTVVVIDYKSGKSAYKQVEHIQQLQLYAAVATLMHPWAETIHSELWYVDEGHVRAVEHTQEQALGFIGRYDVRAQRIFDDKLYRPNPNVQTCRWCPYGPKAGTGACAVGV